MTQGLICEWTWSPSNAHYSGHRPDNLMQFVLFERAFNYLSIEVLQAILLSCKHFRKFEIFNLSKGDSGANFMVGDNR